MNLNATEEEKEIERERQKESIYRSYFSTLLQEHSGLLSSLPEDSSYDEERGKINSVYNTEQKSIAMGVGIGLATFAALRFGVRHMRAIRHLEVSQREAEKSGADWIPKSIGIFIEGAFSVWIGSRAYDLISLQSHDSYKTIAEIPLSKGRSRISKELCGPWLEITEHKIPSTFWKNLDDVDKNLRDERGWEAIRSFATNCKRRQAYEAKLRKDESAVAESQQIYRDSDEPFNLPTQVPRDIQMN